jgi:hypothetical protein
MSHGSISIELGYVHHARGSGIRARRLKFVGASAAAARVLIFPVFSRIRRSFHRLSF